MELKKSRLDDHDGDIVNIRRVKEVYGVRDVQLMLPTRCDLFVQCLAQLSGHAGVVPLLRLRLRDVADHSPTPGWCTAELHARSIAW
eukprot:3518081-Pleurochrysis_carterae.AAC.1